MAKDHRGELLAAGEALKHHHELLADLPPDARALADVLIAYLDYRLESLMPISTTSLKASIAPLETAATAAIPLIESPTALAAAQADIDAATAANVDLTAKLNAAVTAANAAPAA
jgi:hypothetical protein